KYFEPQEIPDHEGIVEPATGQHPRQNPEGGQTDELDENVDIATRAKNALVQRKPTELIELISNQTLSKAGLFAVYRYLLADTSSLGLFSNRQSLSQTFARALDETGRQILGIQQDNPDLADEPARDRLQRAIARERQLLVGVALFSQ